MVVERLIKKSSSGSTKWVDTIYFVVDDPKSLAASILLKNYYWQRDVDNIESIANRMRMIGFSRTYLTQVLERVGHLSCSYCPKTDLVIELEGMKVPNSKKATIDHIIPLSKGGAIFDYSNICVCCGKCNSNKGDKLVEDFLKNKKNLVLSK